MMSSYQKYLLRYALDYVRAGYYVFPLTVELNPESGKKRLRMPFANAEGWNAISTRDEDQLHEWYDVLRKSMSGIAIDCGKSGIVAIDLDQSDTKDGLAEWEKLPEQQPTPMLVRTRSGGMHRFYRDPTGTVKNSVDEVALGIDIRGNGGLVIAAPTRVYGAGGVYSTEFGQYSLMSGIIPVADLPELTDGMIEIIVSRQDPDRPKYDPAIHGDYKVSVAQGREIIRHRLDRIRGGKDMRAAIFGYAVGVAQYEGAKAARDNATLDEDTLSEAIGVQVLEASPWEALNEEDLTWIHDGVTKGLAQPWVIVEDHEVIPEVDPDVPLADLLQREARKMPGHPHVAHALAAPVVVDELVGRYLFVEGIGWHEWVGDRWSPDVQVPVLHAVQQCIIRRRTEARRMLKALEDNVEWRTKVTRLGELAGSLSEAEKAAPRSPDGHEHAALKKTADRVEDWRGAWSAYGDWWFGLSHGQHLGHVMKFVEADPGRIFIRASRLDSDPNLLNAPNGTIDLRTGAIRKHDPADYITKTTRVPYDPSATHPLWDRAREAFAPGIEAWLQMKVGEGAYGVPSHDDTMIFNFGAGSNGKSTLADAVLRSLGNYAVFLHDKAVLGGTDDHGTEKMIYRGARWAVLEELPEAQVLRPAIIKKLIGTSKITARLMRQDNVTFDASHSLMVNANHRPQVLENDRGTWRRLIAIPWPFTFKFPGEELEDETERHADPAIKAGLSRSIEVQKAALAWIVAGAVAFEQNGRTCGPMPEPVQRETDSWRLESDTFGVFFSQELTLEKGSVVPTTELLHEYNEWLASMGKKPVSDNYIATRLATIKGAKSVEKRHVRKTAKGVTVSTRGIVSEIPVRFMGWVGVRWVTDPEKAASDD